MEKVEKYIQEYTNKCSNELGRVTHKDGNVQTSYHEWLTPDQARRVAEIAREEAINDALKVIRRLEKEAYNNYNYSLTKWLGNELNIEEKENYKFWGGVIRACNEITSKILDKNKMILTNYGEGNAQDEEGKNNYLESKMNYETS